MTVANDAPAQCPFKQGLERHVTPASDGQGVVTKTSSDTFFGPEGIGFSGTSWMKIVSWLARDGISKQTGSKPDETIVANCVLGWGQGAFSSRVFRKDEGIDEAAFTALVDRLHAIAAQQGTKDNAITGAVLASYVESQESHPFSTAHGEQTLDNGIDRLGARFRSHIQWQSLFLLCGQIVQGVKQVTPELLTTFFGGEEPFFTRLIERRRLLRTGALKPGQRSGPLSDVPERIDLEATDREYMKEKDALAMVSKITFYILRGKTD